MANSGIRCSYSRSAARSCSRLTPAQSSKRTIGHQTASPTASSCSTRARTTGSPQCRRGIHRMEIGCRWKDREYAVDVNTLLAAPNEAEDVLKKSEALYPRAATVSGALWRKGSRPQHATALRRRAPPRCNSSNHSGRLTRRLTLVCARLYTEILGVQAVFLLMLRTDIS
jgi:hypothetical protein